VPRWAGLAAAGHPLPLLRRALLSAMTGAVKGVSRLTSRHVSPAIHVFPFARNCSTWMPGQARADELNAKPDVVVAI